MTTTASITGTKAVRQPEATRARILEVARVEFVTYGLNGARVDRIAEQAKVNKNLIYHYFGAKDALYLEVLEAIYANLRANQQDDRLRQMPPLEGMRQLVGNTYDHFVATPDLIRLMSIENIHYAQNLKTSSTIKPLYKNLLDTVEDLLKRGQKQRVFRSGVDSVDLYLSISGLAYFFLSNQHTLSWLLDRDIAAKSHLKQRREHVIDLVLSYLTENSKRKSQ
jgi:TetR/AcrR family transcriptional regulator